MNQPMIRTKLTHDPASMEGQAYILPAIALTFDVATSGSGVHNIYTVPAGTWLIEAQAILLTELSGSGTLDIGLDGDTDALIDNTEWTEQNQYAIASSKQTTAPDGIYFSAQDNIAVEAANCSTGKVLILLWLLNVDSIAAAPHSSI
jgi:hypothetical protein